MKDSIPTQHEGKQLDLRATKTFESINRSKSLFRIVKNRLQEPFEWHDIAKVPASSFVLTDGEGTNLMRKMQKNDFIRIDIPGPGNASGDGYDWVQVDEITEDENANDELFSITLRPSSSPENDDHEIAHFFKSMATSTLLVKRKGLEVIAEYHGRNELINADTEKFSDKIRNIVVGLTAKLGLSSSQWQRLIDGLMDSES